MNYKLLIPLLLLGITTHAFAASPTPHASASAASPTPKATQKASPMNDLKERLATKVAELRQSQKKAIYGTVKTLSVSTVTVETQTSDIKIELTDEIKVIQTIKGKRTVLTTDSLDKGDSVVVFGDYDPTLDLLKAKVIVIQDLLPSRAQGVITDIDKKQFTVSIKNDDNQSYIIDIEKTTSVFIVEAAKTITKSGFSKLTVGEVVHVIGTLVPKAQNRLSAIRILDIGVLSDGTPTATLQSSPTASASATKSPAVTPTSTPKATPKPTVKP